jgi:hypothetical protein
MLVSALPDWFATRRSLGQSAYIGSSPNKRSMNQRFAGFARPVYANQVVIQKPNMPIMPTNRESTTNTSDHTIFEYIVDTWPTDDQGIMYSTQTERKISHASLDGQPADGLTRDRIVDNITLYWLTNPATSAARVYWETGRALALALVAGQAPPEVSPPVGFTVFPGEVYLAPRSWTERVYPNLTYFNEVDRGGHFAAREEPELFTAEVRAAFSSVR